MTRIMFPFLLLVALAAQAMGVLNACNRFGVPALASTFFNIGSVAFGLVLGLLAGPQLGTHPHRGHGHRRGARRRAAAGLAAARACTGSGSVSGRPSIGRIPACVRIFRLMGPGDSRQRRGADQRDGEHQFRLHASPIPCAASTAR